jgi:glycosyltransferase involved in cell wall biosynthesis
MNCTLQNEHEMNQGESTSDTAANIEDRKKISGVVISYNRVDLIGTCLRALSFVDELVVVDKSSNDGTAELAATIADRVVVVPWSPVVEETRSFAISQSTHQWVLCLDDDECLSVEAIQFIQRELLAPRARVYMLAQRHYILGIHDERAYYWPEYQPRFFHRGAMTFSQTVHGGAKFDESQVFLVPYQDGACMHHLSHKNVAQWIEKANRYTSNSDRVRAVHVGNDLVAFAHDSIDRYVSASRIEDRSEYPAAVAVLRSVYDIIDRLKSWEEELGLDGDRAFRQRCDQLDAAYSRAFGLAREGAMRIEHASAEKASVSRLGVSPVDEVLVRSVDALREALRSLRAAAEEERSVTRDALERARRELLGARDEFATAHGQWRADLDNSERARMAGELREQDLKRQLATFSTALKETLENLDVAKAQHAELLQAQLQERVQNQLQAADVQRLLDETRIQLHSTLTSSSWRFTAPLRRVATRYPGAVARLKRFVSRHPGARRMAGRVARLGLRLLSGPSAAQEGKGHMPAPAAALFDAAPEINEDKFKVEFLGAVDGQISQPFKAKESKGRLLSVGHVLPYPPRAGNEYRIHQMLTWFAREGWDVLLVVCPLPNDVITDRQFHEAAAVYPQLVICEHGGRVRHNLFVYRAALSDLAGARPRNWRMELAEDAGTEGLSPALLETIRNFSPDFLLELLVKLDGAYLPKVLLAEYVFMTRAFARVRSDVVKVVDTHDVFSTKAAKVEEHGVSDGLAMTEADESMLLNRADILIGIQPGETRDLARLAPQRKVVNVGVDFSVNDCTSGLPEDLIVLLVGANNPMNVKGLRDFLRFSWPLIRREVPLAQFYVVGGVGSALRVVPDGVSLLGRVENLADAYRLARVVINPAVAGTGLKIKTVEALCHLRPLVTFPAGIDGIDEKAAPFCHVATNWFEFAMHVAELLARDPSPTERASQAEILARAFSAETIYAELAKALDDI